MLGMIGWAIILSAFMAWEVWSLIVHDPRHPTLGDILSFFLRARGGRLILYVGWLWLGWHLFVRTKP